MPICILSLLILCVHSLRCIPIYYKSRETYCLTTDCIERKKKKSKIQACTAHTCLRMHGGTILVAIRFVDTLTALIFNFCSCYSQSLPRRQVALCIALCTCIEHLSNENTNTNLVCKSLHSQPKDAYNFAIRIKIGHKMDIGICV